MWGPRPNRVFVDSSSSYLLLVSLELITGEEASPEADRSAVNGWKSFFGSGFALRAAEPLIFESQCFYGETPETFCWLRNVSRHHGTELVTG